MLCAIIPTLNAQTGLTALLSQLRGQVDCVVVSDGGSEDDTLSIALAYSAALALGSSGRGTQLARAAQWSAKQSQSLDDQADWLLFLHADTQLPKDWRDALAHHMRHYHDRAAYFRFGLDDKGVWPAIVSFWVRLRCFWLALPYGDQGLLVRRDHYERVGGYPKWALFEDVQIVRALGRRNLRALPLTVKTDATKYRRDGYRRRTFSNLWLLIKFLTQGRPDILARQYR